MADTTDYLLEAAFGVLQGAKNAYLPFRKAEHEDELTRRRKEQEIKLEEESKIRVLEKTPRDVWNPETKTFETRYGGPITQLKLPPLDTKETPAQKLARAKELEQFKVDLAGEKKKNIEESEIETKRPEVEKKLQIVLDDYDKAINLAKKIKNKVSAKAFFLQKIPFTESKALAQDLETLKTKIGFRALGELKAQSPTGGALGQIAIKEGEWLQGSEVPLSLDSPELKNNLDKLISGYERSKKSVLSGYKNQYKSDFVTLPYANDIQNLPSEVSDFMKQNKNSKFLGYE